MSDCLFVIIGAGASFASTSPENVGSMQVGRTDDVSPPVTSRSLHPPLVTELFDPRFAGILNKYPVAQMAASDIRKQTQTPVAIEDYLRERYRDSDHALDRRKFHAVHWYLQDLLWCVSRCYTRHPDNYDRLISGCLRLPRVVFITLNYDTLLDDRLRIVAPIDRLSDYCDRRRGWSLVKLHGSVDWGTPIESWEEHGVGVIFDPPPRISLEGGFVLRRKESTIAEARLQRDASRSVERILYPAMSVPVGTRDTFSCPPEHVKHLRNIVSEQEALDVLMLGYSALDEEVLKLLKDSGKRLRSLWAVNKDEATASAAYRQVRNVLGRPQHGETYQGGFADFVGTDHFDGYLAWLVALRER